MTTNIKNLQEVIKIGVISVPDENSAWHIVHLLCNEGLSLDNEVSKRVGYKIYSSEDGDTYVCDLETRLEINFKDGTSKNIWID